MVRRYSHYILIPALYMLIAASGRLFNAESVELWYPTLLKPAYTPPGSFIGAMWTVIYILTALSFILYINRSRRAQESPWPVAGAYLINGFFNAAWSYIFFSRKMIGLATADALLIWVTVLIMMVLAWPRSRASSLLLIPYLAWTAFATFLNYRIYILN
jgi:tryptophan-rich sensory protein